MRALHFNGKFYAGSLNGVHRVADRLVRECDRLIAAMPLERRPRAFLHCTSVASWAPDLQAIEQVRDDRPPSQAWEQLRLPRLARGGVLVNLANLAPLAHRRQVTLIHDMQFMMADSGYPLRQRIGYRWLVPRMARASRRVFTVSEFSRQMLAITGVIPRERVGVLHNGADHMREIAACAKLEPVTGPPNRVILFGSPKPYKNNKVIFDAFATGQLAGFQLVMIGPDRAELHRAGLTPPPDAEFVGACDDAVLAGLLHSAHCLVFPSRTEGFGLPPVEAMLCDCPVVAAPAGAIPEICRDVPAYADVDDPSSWVAAILALQEPAQRAARIAAGRTRSQAFTWERAGGALLDTIMDLATE